MGFLCYSEETGFCAIVEMPDFLLVAEIIQNLMLDYQTAFFLSC